MLIKVLINVEIIYHVYVTNPLSPYKHYKMDGLFTLLIITAVERR